MRKTHGRNWVNQQRIRTAPKEPQPINGMSAAAVKRLAQQPKHKCAFCGKRSDGIPKWSNFWCREHAHIPNNYTLKVKHLKATMPVAEALSQVYAELKKLPFYQFIKSPPKPKDTWGEHARRTEELSTLQRDYDSKPAWLMMTPTAHSRKVVTLSGV